MAKTVVFVPDVASMQTEFHTWPGLLGRYMRGKTMKLNTLAHASAPRPGRAPRNRTGINYSTGKLFGSIYPRMSKHRNELEGRVVTTAKHALFVHEGTDPHVIVPRRAPRLRFFWHKVGHVVYLQKVNHPGTRAQPFLAENLRAALR